MSRSGGIIIIVTYLLEQNIWLIHYTDYLTCIQFAEVSRPTISYYNVGETCDNDSTDDAEPPLCSPITSSDSEAEDVPSSDHDIAFVNTFIEESNSVIPRGDLSACITSSDLTGECSNPISYNVDIHLVNYKVKSLLYHHRYAGQNYYWFYNHSLAFTFLHLRLQQSHCYLHKMTMYLQFKMFSDSIFVMYFLHLYGFVSSEA